MNLYPRSLKEYINHLENKNAWTPKEKGRVAIQVLDAVVQIHNVNVIHGDIAVTRRSKDCTHSLELRLYQNILQISPGNFLVDEGSNILICDFGLSHKLGKASDSAVGDEIYAETYFVNKCDVGKQPIWWMAPELINVGDLYLTKKSDAYMLGCTREYVILIMADV